MSSPVPSDGGYPPLHLADRPPGAHCPHGAGLFRLDHGLRRRAGRPGPHGSGSSRPAAEHDILVRGSSTSRPATPRSARRGTCSHWNREKFPDPEAIRRGYREAGVRHRGQHQAVPARRAPASAEARARACSSPMRGRAGPGPSSGTAWAPIWTSPIPTAVAWWQGRLTTTLLGRGTSRHLERQQRVRGGLAAPARGHVRRRPRAAIEAKPLQTLLMMRASREAQRAHAPDLRPFLASRARARRACIAMPRPGPATTPPPGRPCAGTSAWAWAWRSAASPTSATTSAASPAPRRTRSCSSAGSAARSSAPLLDPLLERRRQRQRAVDASRGPAGRP